MKRCDIQFVTALLTIIRYTFRYFDILYLFIKLSIPKKVHCISKTLPFL